ncbi:hypothetical protein [Spirosoma arboris]|uniref:hypothetical protein n=1 Tax=Spirosoma arboris TaxID=2682092 RepID=UPI0018DB2306|nr:hypothetical protein [Spirosoma arboris]
MRDRILHEIGIICRAEGLMGDLSHLLAKPPLVMAIRLSQLKVNIVVTSIIAGWGQELTDQEVLFLLKSINDKGLP